MVNTLRTRILQTHKGKEREGIDLEDVICIETLEVDPNASSSRRAGERVLDALKISMVHSDGNRLNMLKL
jgi:hypothetical protein